MLNMQKVGDKIVRTTVTKNRKITRITITERLRFLNVMVVLSISINLFKILHVVINYGHTLGVLILI